MRHERGFTLLEAVVALALLAAGALALYGWINTGLIGLQRANDVNQSVELIDNAIELVSAMDPTQQQEGQLAIGDGVVYWVFEPTDYRAPALGADGGLSLNDMQLFKANVQVRRNNRTLARFSFWLLGIEQTRTISEVLFD